MKKTLVLSLFALAVSLAGCSRCVASDSCNAEGKGRVAEINVNTMPSVSLRYTACEGLRYRQIGFGNTCLITWQ